MFDKLSKRPNDSTLTIEEFYLRAAYNRCDKVPINDTCEELVNPTGVTAQELTYHYNNIKKEFE